MTDANRQLVTLSVGDRATTGREYEVRRYYHGGMHSSYVLATLAAARDKASVWLALPDTRVTIHERQVTTTEGPWKLVEQP